MWMRRTGIAAIVAALVVLIGAPPAFAAQPPPGIVDDVPLLPSSAVKMSQGTDGSWVLRTLNAMAAANRSTALATVPKPVPVPITPPANLVRGASGGPLTGAFMAGWTITDGVLALYGAQTGANPLQGSCGWDAVGQSVVTVLYPLSKPDCSIPAVNPNSDVVAGWTAATSGNGSVRLVGTNAAGTTYCYQYTPDTSGGSGVGYPRASGTFVTSPPASWSGAGCAAGQSYLYVSQWQSTPSSMPGGVLVFHKGGAVVGTSPKQMTADPIRSLNCTIKWRDGSTTTGSSGTYRESAGIPLGGIQAGCQQAFVSKPGAGPGLLPSEIKVGSTNTDTGAQTEISTQPVPDFDATQKQALSPGANGGLRLLKIAGTQLDSCMTWAADCAGWWAQSNNGTNEDTYKCVFAGQPVALSECGVYRETFDTKTATPTITDPVTGAKSDWSSSPATGNSTSPGAAGDVAPGAKCMSEWGSAPNPLEWVFTPIKCALVWAFVPRQSEVSATVTALGAAAGSVALVDPLLTLVQQLPQSSGCEGIPFDLTFFGTAFHGRILAACEGETRAVATVVNGLLALVIITGAVIAVTRYAAAVFGFVGPGGSMEQTQRQTERIIERSGKGGG